ncbi:GNAT family N-acetyltransferase [Marinobacter alexandrii]|uniref:GNAT family N-acetyltransferase n=1 Tax=Marinobacter alexandrii TaxID=2570351 RepID=UPI0032976F23
MEVRALTPSDAISFQALRLRSLQEFPEAFASSYEEEVDMPLLDVEGRLELTPDSVVFGSFNGEQLCALVGVQRETMVKLAHKSFIWGVYVAPESRGRGIATQIMKHALSHAVNELGSRQVNLGVSTKNEAALSLYRKLGFVEYGLERGYLLVDGVLQDEYLMALTVENGIY